MLAHMQMARLTCAALIERRSIPVTVAARQGLGPERHKTGENKIMKLSPAGNPNVYRRNQPHS
ncbi:MAG: hypothetical protein PVG59_21815 [Desulfobacterales bacterium]